MQCYTGITPPTAVTHCIRFPFISADSNNLIVAKTSLLQIYTTKTIFVEIDTGSELEKLRRSDRIEPTILDDGIAENSLASDSLRTDRARRTKLVLVAEYTLSGTVTSLVRVKTVSSKSGGEALLVGLKDAKLSLVEWDPILFEISTISIHYYEQDDLHISPWAPGVKDCVSFLTADPGSRCAALKFGLRSMAILPFKQGDEDVNMDEWDHELDEPRPVDKGSSRNTNGNTVKNDTPYCPSFVLRLPSLDSTIRHPIHLAFLYEYREPTFGILSSTHSPSSSLLFERKDNLTYMVFTLDLHQKASTTILSVGGLPFDLNQVVPLPAPVGGALLVGWNELIHVDQAGKVNGVAVNIFAKQCTSLNLLDQSELEIRLEGCKIEQLSIQNGDLIMILKNGQLAILSFYMDGRSVSGLGVRKVSDNAGGFLFSTRASCVSSLGSNTIFIGSECGDSVILGWSRNSCQNNRRKYRLELSEELDDISLEEDDDDADDDLYGDGSSVNVACMNESSGAANSKAGDYVFHIHDSLINIGPISDLCFGKSSKHIGNYTVQDAEYTSSELDMVAAIGKGSAGSLAIIHQNIQLRVIGRFKFPEARGIWTVTVRKPGDEGSEATKDKMKFDHRVKDEYSSLMIVSKQTAVGSEISDVYALTSANFEALTGTEFEPAAGPTIEASTLGNSMRIIQVLKSEVRSYDGSKFINFLQLDYSKLCTRVVRGDYIQQDFAK